MIDRIKQGIKVNKIMNLKEHKKLHHCFIKIWQCNKQIYVLRNFYKNTDALFNLIEIETISSCNRSCSFCPVSVNKKNHRRPFGKMKTRLFNKIVDELEELNYEGVVALYRYGEPLLDDRLEKFAHKVRNQLGDNVNIRLNTNGDFLTYDKFKSLIDAGINTFSISQYDFVPSLSLKTFLSKVTEEDKQYFDYEIKMADNPNFTNRGGLIILKSGLTPITCNMMHFGIRHNGEASVCCNDYYNEIRFGNIQNEKIIDIWNSNEYRTFRNEIKRGIFKYEVCKRCIGEMK